MDKKALIQAILDLEWPMFHNVNGEDGPKADCQNDHPTFIGMRTAQFDAWDEATLASYLEDLQAAKAAGRNLDTEKYIHMMRSTYPLKYEELKKQCVFPDQEGLDYAEKITDKMIEQTVALFDTYPYVAGSGRPLRSQEDWGGVTSIETYQKGELYTYSTRTLKLLWEHMQRLEAQGVSIARIILENGIKYYGYKNLEEAEAATKKHAESLPIEFSFGCGCCSDDGDCCG